MENLWLIGQPWAILPCCIILKTLPVLLWTPQHRYQPRLGLREQESRLLQLDRRILEEFPRTQHRPSLIKSSKMVVSLPSEPYKQWSFHKAKCKKYMSITNRLAQDRLHQQDRHHQQAFHLWYLCWWGLPRLLQQHHPCSEKINSTRS